MRIDVKKVINFLKVKIKYFYIYILFKFNPVVFYNNNTLRGFGKTWLIIKTASEYKMPIISTVSSTQYVKETAKIMKEQGIIKNIPTVYNPNQHFNGFGEVNVLLDTDIKIYNELKHNYQNIHIVGGFVFDPNYKKEQKENKI